MEMRIGWIARLLAVRRRTLWISALGVFVLYAPAHAQAPPPPEPLPPPTRLEVDRPEGFDELVAPQEALLDLYVAGQPLGKVAVLTEPGRLRFIDPAALIARLPPLTDPDAVLDALTGWLNSNSGKSCLPRPALGCGRLDLGATGVILSRDAARIDLFLASDLRAAPRRTIADPQPGPATLAGALGLQYSLGRQGVEFTFRPQAVLGLGRGHLAVDASIGDRLSTLDRAYYRRSGHRTQLSAGLLETRPFSFLFFDRFFGVSLASTSNTRLDRDSLSDTPLILDAPLSGRVEILRDGVLLETQRIAPGQVTLDTANLPGGAYPLTLRIVDASGERSETRFFARAGGLPPYGEIEFFVEAGAYASLRGLSRSFLPDLLSPVLRAGVAHRLAPQLGVSARIEAGQHRQLAEAGVTWLQSNWRLTGSVAATARGDHAGAVTISGRSGQFNWSLDARMVESEAQPLGRFDPERGLGRSFRQISGFGGWRSGRFSMNTGLLWRLDPLGRSSYSILPSARWSLGERPGRRWELETSGSVSRGSWMARLGLRLSLHRGRTSSAISAGVETRNTSGVTLARPILRGDWGTNRDSDWGPLSLRASVSQEFNRLSGHAGANLSNPYFIAGLDAQIDEELENSTLYGRIDTSFGLAEGVLAFGGDRFTGAGIVAQAPGAPDDARISVRAPGTGRRLIEGDGRHFVSVPPYSQGSIGLNISGGSGAFDTRSDPAVFYPGTVRYLVRKSRRVTIIYARLVDRSGAPIANAAVDGEVGLATSDAQGRIQIEVVPDETLQVQPGNGAACTVAVPQLDQAAIFRDAGTLVCNPTLPPAP